MEPDEINFLYKTLVLDLNEKRHGSAKVQAEAKVEDKIEPIEHNHIQVKNALSQELL
jgi:hypothetical protein